VCSLVKSFEPHIRYFALHDDDQCDKRHESMHSILPIDYEKRMRVNRLAPIMPRHDGRQWAAIVQTAVDAVLKRG
jgi:hypothetical protein